MRHSIAFDLLALVALATAPQAVEASLLASDMLYRDGTTISHLEDNSWLAYADTNENGLIDGGEYLYGMFDIRSVRDAYPGTQGVWPPQSEMFAGVFVAQIGGIDEENARFSGGATIDLLPAPADIWESLALDAPANPGQTLFAMYSDPDGPLSTVDPLAAGGIGDSLASATNGTKLWEFGFLGDSDPNERWWCDVDTLDYLLLDGLRYRAAMNVTWSSPTAADLPTLGAHDFFGWANRNLPAPSAVQLTGNLESFSAGNFDFRIDSDFYVRAVPEPGTLVCLVIGALALGLDAIARRKKA